LLIYEFVPNKTLENHLHGKVIFLFHFINIDFKYPSPVLLTRTYAM
jgi:hypothetical protein